ncbi:uncharacterized protein ARB_06766 [Trichophyton benhamiae CBS 112371]|uniref:Uncharacterized protein n=1 Tax=Arthroderma benhamiae (strain ATCC MYA-4681 / CBS 112371) TaxID=663331 RepID=D4ARM3_ARTBC|nr:uncharacterized protein ARB_06766 [Trichophyton benhamiae CBS 112371]EFE34366.1 hypothetical protein ARB_06766 [Trichophyton benhamiae CBS 112371]
MTILTTGWFSCGRLQLVRSKTALLLCFFSGMALVYLFYFYDNYTPVPPPALQEAVRIPQAVVLPKTKWDRVGWVKQLEPEWTPFVYSVDGDERYTLRTPKNVGREAMVYLSFIIDYYHSLPEVMAFTHSANKQWHNDFKGRKTVKIISALQIQAVKRKGYANLRCLWEPGCPTSLNPLSPTEIDIREQNERAHLPEIYMELFNVSRSEVPEHIGGVCCAQFAVTRERVQKRPREDYVRMREWALDARYTSFGVGWVFEQIWHIIFMEEAIQ